MELHRTLWVGMCKLRSLLALGFTQCDFRAPHNPFSSSSRKSELAMARDESNALISLFGRIGEPSVLSNVFEGTVQILDYAGRAQRGEEGPWGNRPTVFWLIIISGLIRQNYG